MILLLNKIIYNFILSSIINGDQPLSYAIKNTDLSAIKKRKLFYQMMFVLKILFGDRRKKEMVK